MSRSFHFLFHLGRKKQTNKRAASLFGDFALFPFKSDRNLEKMTLVNDRPGFKEQTATFRQRDHNTRL